MVAAVVVRVGGWIGGGLFVIGRVSSDVRGVADGVDLRLDDRYGWGFSGSVGLLGLAEEEAEKSAAD